MSDNKLLTLEPSTAIPICPYCGCLIAKPIKLTIMQEAFTFIGVVLFFYWFFKSSK